MNEEPLGALILPEEQMALETLADGILADINARLNRLIRRLGLKRVLEIFNITVVGIQIATEIDDETRAYLLDRKRECGEESFNGKDRDVPDYYS